MVTLGAAAAIAATAATGTPSTLPDIALACPALLHLERTLAFLAVYLVLLMVVSRAWSGELPSAVSTQGVTYSANEAKDATSETVKALWAELALLRVRVNQLENAE
ncbi:MAG: hypothetical protein QOF65_2774 [Thermoleophilaceae bacterium]|jgi:hypothetical protein|nr:hypothetical protein [Thermoleophilaceae bacterium]